MLTRDLWPSVAAKLEEVPPWQIVGVHIRTELLFLRDPLVQVMFNVAALALSIAAAYQVSHVVLALARVDSVPVLLALAACLYFVSNTLLISGVLCLLDKKPLTTIWQQCYLWSFPYYLVGSVIAGLVTMSSRAVGWEASLLVLPLMYLVYLFYRFYLQRMALEPQIAV